MAKSIKLVCRIGLQALLILALGLGGGIPEDAWAPIGTSKTDPASEQTIVVSPELAGLSAKVEREPGAVAALAARVTALDRVTYWTDRAPTLGVAVTFPPLFLSHCAFLC